MAVERIDSLYDVQAITQEQQQVVGAIDATQAKLVALYGTIQNNNGSNVLNIGANANELSTAINNLSQKVNALATNLNVMRQAAKSSVGGMTDLEKAQLAYQKSISLTNEQIQGYKVQTAAANQAAKAAAKEALGLNDAYQKLQNTYIQLQRDAKNAAVEFGTNSVQFKTAAAAANEAGNELKNIDGTLGQFNRNVGNYKSGFASIGGALNGALTPLRTLANIIPGLGLGGIFLGIATGIGAAVEAMGLFSTKATEASRSAELLGAAFHSDDYEKATRGVEELSINIDLAKKGFLSKTEVLKQYNDTLGQTIGHANSLDEAEQLLVKNGDAYVKMTLFKAAANQALDKAAKAALETEEKRNKTAQDFETIGTNASAFGAGQVSAPGFVPNLSNVNAGIQARAAAAEKARQAAIKDGEKDQKTYEDIAKKFQEQAAKIATDNKFDFFGGKMNPKEVKEKVDQSAKAEYEALKAALEAEAKLRQSFADNQASFGEQTSIEQAKQASALRMQIIDLENKHDLSEKGLTEAAKDAINKKYSDQRLNEETTLQGNISKIQKAARENQLKEDEKIQKELAAMGDSPEYQYGTATAARTRSEVEITKNGFDEMQKLRDAAFTQELADINEQVNKKAISYQEGQKKILNITYAYTKDSLEKTKKSLEDQLNILVKGGLAGSKAADDLRLAIAKLNKELSGLGEDTRLKKLDALYKQLSTYKDMVADFTTTITNLNDIAYEKQKAQIESLQNLEDDRYKKEVDNINNSTLSDQDKANKLKILEAQHQTQQEQNAKKLRQLDNQKARFDKTANIANIIMTTSLAVVKALTIPGPLGIAAAALAGAAGASALAKAIATPVPQYAQGTENHPGGAAWVGDGGEHELVQERSGKTWITPNTPTLVNLAKGAKVTPLSDDLNKAMYNTMLIKTGGAMRSTEDMSVREQTRALAKAFKNNRPKVTNNINVDFGHWQYIQSQIKN